MSRFRLLHAHMLVLVAMFAGALGLIQAWRSAAGEWKQSPRVGTFQIRSEFPLGDANGQRLLNEMARLQLDVESRLGLQGTGEPIAVNLFKSRESYVSSLLPRIPEAENRSALFVAGKLGQEIYVYHRPEFEQDLRHECTHAVLHQSLTGLPLWLDEGLAEYFEQPPELRAHGNPYLSELQNRITAGWAPDLSRLEVFSTLHELQAEDYQECWAWTHLLLHGSPEIQLVLRDYLNDMATRLPAGHLSDRLRACSPDMDVQLIHHLQSW